jgi:predicted metal-binding transcription factor (methanogenesis marker protein 9)
MAFRIKKEHLGKRIVKGNETFILNENLSDNEILYVKNMLSSEFVEQYDVKQEKAKIEVDAYVDKKKNKDVDDK